MNFRLFDNDHLRLPILHLWSLKRFQPDPSPLCFPTICYFRAKMVVAGVIRKR
ncbi:hypothetical protein HanIR_Chr11g0554951 [Helianthus annuus]|nr:hypothetical protein HanIR_Chr11g0554951 [Helianthus annuus]